VPDIRRARLEEGDLLTDILVRSKAYWGYDDAFLESARPELEFQQASFCPTFMFTYWRRKMVPAGFCSLISRERECDGMHDFIY